MNTTENNNKKWKYWILLEEVIPQWYKKEINYEFDTELVETNPNYYDTVYTESKFSIMTLEEYSSKWQLKNIFKNCLKNFIKNKWNIEDFTNNYKIKAHLICYQESEETEDSKLIEEITIMGYENYKLKNQDSFEEFWYICYGKSDLLNHCKFIDNEYEEKKFTLKVSMLNHKG